MERLQQLIILILIFSLFSYKVSAGEYRVTSYNILADEQHLFSPGHDYALADALKARSIDLALFQEVLYPNVVSVNNTDESIKIKQALDSIGYPMYMYRIRYPRETEWRAMAIFSKYPFSETGSKVLSGERFGQMARVITPYGYIRVINNHLQTNDRQCPGFYESVRDYGELFGDNVIFGGDMNIDLRARCEWQTTEDKYVMACTDETNSQDKCTNPLDHIGIDRRLKANVYTAYQVNIGGISDHNMVVAQMQVPEKAVTNPIYLCDFDYDGVTRVSDIVELISKYFQVNSVIKMCDADLDNKNSLMDIVLNTRKLFN